MSVESIAEELGLILPKDVLFEYWCLARGIEVPFRLRAQISSSWYLHYWRGILRSASDRFLCDTLPSGARGDSLPADWVEKPFFHFRGKLD